MGISSADGRGSMAGVFGDPNCRIDWFGDASFSQIDQHSGEQNLYKCRPQIAAVHSSMLALAITFSQVFSAHFSMTGRKPFLGQTVLSRFVAQQ